MGLGVPTRNSIALNAFDFSSALLKHRAIMFGLLYSVIAILVSAFKSRRALMLENLALRQQVVLLKRSVKRPRVTVSDRIFWSVFAHNVEEWRKHLYALHPDTVVRWHKVGFRWYWTRKSCRIGRPPIEPELRKLIRDIQAQNVTWGAPRIHGELLKLGYNISEATVSKYMKRHRRPPSQSWRTFLANHAEAIAAVDFFTVVPTRNSIALNRLTFLQCCSSIVR